MHLHFFNLKKKTRDIRVPQDAQQRIYFDFRCKFEYRIIDFSVISSPIRIRDFDTFRNARDRRPMELTMRNVILGLMVSACLWPLTSGLGHVTMTSWRRLSGQDLAVSGYEVWVRGRSKVECIRECNKYSHCTSFVFNVSSRTCYLQPALDNTVNTASLGLVYVNTEPRCMVQHAPAINGSVTWSHTLTSLKGRVTCFVDFMNTINDVTLECRVDGSWETAGDCVQHVWRNPPPSLFPLTLPFPVTSGWSVCMEGAATAHRRFNFDLMVDKQNRPLHVSFLFNYVGMTDTIYMARQVGGSNLGSKTHTPIPFSVGQPFHIRIMPSAAATYQLFVDNVSTTNFPQVANMPPTAVTQITVLFDVNVTLLDVWCQW
ncbi:uncharacterized protein [Littorina saxatilis]|uniref:uncharacterized protein n=1 Tax=Littorina saxatilis TaxID=31220 RepID=UPI0038B5F52F